MLLIVWTYEVAEENRAAFESAYGADGVWVRFFRAGAGYLGTELVRSETDRYLTIDRWETRAAHESFVAAHREQYAKIDAECGALTERERFVGSFESLQQS